MNKNMFIRLFSIIILIFGFLLLFTGFNNSLSKSYKYRNYKVTTGYFMQYDLSQNNTEYILTYSYVVDNYTYFVKSNNTVTKLPKLGVESKIKYNPKNPKKSFVVEINTKNNFKYIFIGLLFIIMASFVLVNRALENIKLNDNKIIKRIGILLGLFLISIGVYIYYTLGIISDSWALIDVYNNSKLIILISFILVLMGMIIDVVIYFFKDE